QEGQPYNQPFTATGGTTPYTFTSTALPTGLTLDPATGVLSGTPTVNGSFPFDVTVTDSSGTPQSDTNSYTLIIDPIPPLVLAPPDGALPNAQQNQTYTQTFTATGGTTPYTFTSTALPTGLTLDPATGVLSGTPTVNGSFPFDVTVTDSTGTPQSDTNSYTLVIDPDPIIVTPATLPDGVVGVAYTQTIGATGGSGSYVDFDVPPGTLPPPLTLDPVTGVLSGTPNTVGTFSFTITVTDSLGATGSQLYTIDIVVSTPLTLSPLTVPDGTEGATYAPVTITPSGGVGPYTLTQAGTLPTGMNFNPVSGILFGLPAVGTAGTYPFTVTVTDSAGGTFTGNYSLVINAPGALTISPASMVNGTV
ncbi:MAG: Ig domain-containing protein, partial [Cutibacterium acnes]|nr:Ig domain-containing protein [Cutibacterium acnes]